MHIDAADAPIVKWAVDRGLIFSYDRTNGLAGTHLKLHIGLCTAFFKHGKLTHLSAAADGRQIDQLMCEFTDLFGLCAQSQAYLEQGPDGPADPGDLGRAAQGHRDRPETAGEGSGPPSAG
jgi:hypothetical protein